MLEEAIDVFKRLRTKYPAEPPVTSKQLDMAIQLGIEALERLRDDRNMVLNGSCYEPLPSETERQELPTAQKGYIEK